MALLLSHKVNKNNNKKQLINRVDSRIIGKGFARNQEGVLHPLDLFIKIACLIIKREFKLAKRKGVDLL